MPRPYFGVIESVLTLGENLHLSVIILWIFSPKREPLVLAYSCVGHNHVSDITQGHTSQQCFLQNGLKVYFWMVKPSAKRPLKDKLKSGKNLIVSCAGCHGALQWQEKRRPRVMKNAKT